MKRLFLILIPLILPLRLWGTDYYVTKTGNNANAGTSKAVAWLTIEKANNTLVAGDIVHVYQGVYTDTIQPSNYGTAADRIKYIAEEDSVFLYNAAGGSTARNLILDGTPANKCRYITIDGFIFTGYTYSVWIEDARDIIIRNCIWKVRITGQYLDAGIVIQDGASNVTIEGCIVAFRGNASTQGRFVYVAGDTVMIRNNTFVRSNVGYAGMSIVATGSYVTINDNIFLCTATNANDAVACHATAKSTTSVGVNYYYNFVKFSDNLTDTTQVVKANPLLWDATYSNLVLYDSDYHDDFKLRITSPCIGSSSDGLDVGAEPNVIIYLRD